MISNFDKGTAPFLRGELIRMREEGFRIKKGVVVEAKSVKYVGSLHEWCVDVCVPGDVTYTGYRASRFEPVKKKESITMAVIPFYQLHDLTDLTFVKKYQDLARKAHEAIQKLEAGANPTTNEQAAATFIFLCLIGFYGKGYTATMKGNPYTGYQVESLNRIPQWKGWYSLHPMLGPDADPHQVKMSEQMVQDSIKASWPKATVIIGDGIEDKEDDYWVVTIREGGYDKNPLASGSATSKDKTIALMQAYVRMLEDVLSRCVGMIYEQGGYVKTGITQHKPQLHKDDFWENMLHSKSIPWRPIPPRKPVFPGFDPTWMVFDESHTMKPQKPHPTPEERDATARKIWGMPPRQAGKTAAEITRDAEIAIARRFAKQQIDDIFDKLAKKYKGSLG